MTPFSASWDTTAGISRRADNWTDLTPPDWREQDAQWLLEHKSTGLRPPIEKEYFRKDGSRVPIMLGSATIEEGGNQLSLSSSI